MGGGPVDPPIKPGEGHDGDNQNQSFGRWYHADPTPTRPEDLDLMEPYARQDPPAWVDHAAFGDACPTISLTDSRAQTRFGRTITTRPPIDLPVGRSWCPDLGVEPVDNFLRACRTEFVDCCTDPFEATVFPPEHAVFASGRGDGCLLTESLWHSQLFFSD